MGEITEVLPPHNTAAVIPPNGDGEKVEIPKAELDTLKHRASESSQNFERLKKAQEEIGDLRAQLEGGNNTVLSDPDVVAEKVGKLEEEISSLKEKQHRSEVTERYPVLKDKWAELEEFRALDDNKGMNLQTAAKAFLTEKGLLDPQRKGLERPTGGPRAPVATGMTSEQVADLRKNNPKKYGEMVRKGQIVFNE